MTHILDRTPSHRMLAIIVPDLFHASQSFLHEHIAQVAPGRTVVVHLSSTGAAARTNVPVLEVVLRRPWREPAVPGLRTIVRQANVHRAATLTRDARRRIAAFLCCSQVTHVFAEFASAASSVLPVVERLGLPLAVMSHGWDINVLGSMPQWRWRYRSLFSRARLIANGPFLRDQMVATGARSRDIVIVPCALPIAGRTVKAQGSEIRVAMVARMTPQKGPLQSLRAFARATREDDRLRMDVVGDGPLLPEFIAAVEAQGLRDRVTIHRAQSHGFVANLLTQSHILIQHCLTLPGGGIETQGLSVMEAMSHGVVPIVTDHGAFPTYIRQGQNGWLVPEGDIEAMAARIVAMAADPTARAQIGARARADVIRDYSRAAIYPKLRTAIGL